MKKTLLSLAGIVALSATLWWVANAQLVISDLFSEGQPIEDGVYTKLLSDYDTSRWYFDASVTCDVNNGITITSSVVEDSIKDEANIYNLFISPYRMDQIKDWDSSVDISKIMMKKVEITKPGDEIKFEISADDVDPNVEYYGFISPVNMYDEIGAPSKEICFKLASNMCLQDTACDTLSAAAWDEEEIERHGAASDCVWMDLAGVTHSVNGDVLTLKWNTVDGDSVEIAVLDPKEEVYKSLWTVKMSDEKFDYKMQWDWEQNFKLTNGCKGVKYKADAKRWEPQPEIPATPATGPAENVLYVAIAAIVLYGAYVVFFRKSDNK